MPMTTHTPPPPPGIVTGTLRPGEVGFNLRSQALQSTPLRLVDAQLLTSETNAPEGDL